MAKIQISHLSFAYDGSPDLIFDDVSLQLDTDWKLGFVGRNGRGKTTLLRILAGLEAADAGAVTGIAGRRLGVVFQEDRLIGGLTALDNVRLVNPALRREEVLAAFGQMALADCADQPARELSGGMARRVALLRALLSDAELLLLDEPFKGLDEETRETVMAQTRILLRGRTCLLVTHDAREAEALGAEILPVAKQKS